MRPGKLTYDEFISALKMLDDVINTQLSIRAIGGFGLMANARIHKQFEMHRSESHDIDSLIEINKSIQECIQYVSRLKDISCDWLNNEFIEFVPNDPIADNVQWQEVEKGTFHRIRLYVADLESIFNYKLKAIYDVLDKIGYLDGYEESISKYTRLQDLIDVKDILDFYGEYDMNELHTIRIRVNDIDLDPVKEFINKHILHVS